MDTTIPSLATSSSSYCCFSFLNPISDSIQRLISKITNFVYNLFFHSNAPPSQVRLILPDHQFNAAARLDSNTSASQRRPKPPQGFKAPKRWSQLNPSATPAPSASPSQPSFGSLDPLPPSTPSLVNHAPQPTMNSVKSTQVDSADSLLAALVLKYYAAAKSPLVQSAPTPTLPMPNLASPSQPSFGSLGPLPPSTPSLVNHALQSNMDKVRSNQAGTPHPLADSSLFYKTLTTFILKNYAANLTAAARPSLEQSALTPALLVPQSNANGLGCPSHSAEKVYTLNAKATKLFNQIFPPPILPGEQVLNSIIITFPTATALGTKHSSLSSIAPLPMDPAPQANMPFTLPDIHQTDNSMASLAYSIKAATLPILSLTKPACYSNTTDILGPIPRSPKSISFFLNTAATQLFNTLFPTNLEVLGGSVVTLLNERQAPELSHASKGAQLSPETKKRIQKNGLRDPAQPKSVPPTPLKSVIKSPSTLSLKLPTARLPHNTPFAGIGDKENHRPVANGRSVGNWSPPLNPIPFSLPKSISWTDQQMLQLIKGSSTPNDNQQSPTLTFRV